jgi:ATP-dependent Clp protease ATP-binding subunit ClpB
MFLGPRASANRTDQGASHFLFDDESALRADMSVHGETSVARLIGAPPGYVGYAKAVR